MDRFVIIGATEFQKPLIEKAKEIGLETHVFAWEKGAVGKEAADFFYPISVTEKDTILGYCKKIQPVGIATVASDLCNITVQYIAERMGLPCNSKECIQKTTNKYSMRDALKEANVRTPGYVCISDAEEVAALTSDLTFPLVIKPTDRSGSRGITLVHDITVAAHAIDTAIGYSFEKKAIAEEYIDGKEYSCESISFNGKHYMIAFTEKYTTGDPHYIETGHIQPAGLSENGRKMAERAVCDALQAFGVKYGASHTEFKVDRDKVTIIESGSRMGGDCIGTHLVPLSTGFDYLKAVINTAMGIDPMAGYSHGHTDMSVGIRFIIDEESADRLDVIKHKYPVKLIEDYHNSRKSTEITESGDRYGYYIVSGKDRADVKETLDL